MMRAGPWPTCGDGSKLRAPPGGTAGGAGEGAGALARAAGGDARREVEVEQEVLAEGFARLEVMATDDLPQGRQVVDRAHLCLMIVGACACRRTGRRFARTCASRQ